MFPQCAPCGQGKVGDAEAPRGGGGGGSRPNIAACRRKEGKEGPQSRAGGREKKRLVARFLLVGKGGIRAYGCGLGEKRKGAFGDVLKKKRRKPTTLPGWGEKGKVCPPI